MFPRLLNECVVLWNLDVKIRLGHGKCTVECVQPNINMAAHFTIKDTQSVKKIKSLHKQGWVLLVPTIP